MIEEPKENQAINHILPLFYTFLFSFSYFATSQEHIFRGGHCAVPPFIDFDFSKRQNYNGAK